MCGIAGFIQSGSARRIAEPMLILRAMTDAVRHRGPDDEGYYVAGPVALGHRRLRIIDLETGGQPMTNEDGSLILVYNGEVYNFRELRVQLEAKGHAFRTHSDTEVILHAYEEYGEGCLDRFNGMFAFALWDGRRGRLFAARDRMGKKPFYYAMRDGIFIFGSEMKALLKHPLVRPEMSPYTMSRYLAFGYVPAPDTIYHDVLKLPPGHQLIFENGRCDVRPYWQVEFDRAPLAGLSEAELHRRFLDLLRDAVRLRLVSDVPLGVFLSGGVDSSAVVAMMCELMPPKDVKTFTIGFRESQYDESAWARRVARHCGTDHHEKWLDESLMLARLPEVIARMDEPFADSSMSPTSLVSEFARSEVTVALGGDGGDELFAGYGTFWFDRMAAAYARVPGALRAMGEWPVRAFADLSHLRWLHRGVQYIGDAARAAESWRVMSYSEAALTPTLQRRLLRTQDPETLSPERLYADTIAHYHRTQGQSRLRRLQEQFQTQYLPDDILTKVDRASMAYALEVRAPLLDHRIVDFANSLPDALKLHGRRGKWFLKKALTGRLPEELLRRPKMGFGIPLADWLRKGLRPTVERVLQPRFLEAQGLFQPEALGRAWQEHLSGRRNQRGLLWTFLAFQLWWEQHRPTLRRP